MKIFDKFFPQKTDEKTPQKNDFSVGDIFYTHTDDQFHLYKLLACDSDFSYYHVLSYKPLETLPSVNSIKNGEIFAYHLPLDQNGFKDAILLTNERVTSSDLIGYHEYLKQTQEPNYYIPIANQYYQDGLRLTDEHAYPDAIDSYSKVIDLMPQFFEAMDNRAFCKMDLGLWFEAIEDFQKSLEINPSGFVAEFALGECYLKMKNYTKSREHLEKAIAKEPANQGPKKYLEVVLELEALDPSGSDQSRQIK